MNCLILFSGTKSFEKVLEPKGCKCYSVDLDNKFKPTFNVDILKWDYKTDLEDIHIDYLHSSPVCKEFTPLKNYDKSQRDMGLGLSLVVKTLEILEWLLERNPYLQYTIENPRGVMRNLDIMKPYNRVTCSYCMYGFPYSKPTDFWYGGFDLELELCSRRKRVGNHFPYGCKCLNENDGIHPVRIGFVGSYQKDGTKKFYEHQEIGYKYFKKLRNEDDKYKGYTDTYFRYRIPSKLIESIYSQLEKKK